MLLAGRLVVELDAAGAARLGRARPICSEAGQPDYRERNMAKKKATKKAKRPKSKLPEEKARVLKERIKQSGKATRAKGHLSASTRRAQAKRDAANS